MATASGPEDSRLKFRIAEERLRSGPFNFRFFQAVRLIQLLRPGRLVGHIERPANEAVRFSVRNSLEFPASDIFSLDWEQGKQPVLCVNFMGLTGPSGVLPLTYSEEVIEMILRHKDHSLESFLNMFNHRMISLFYRAWEKYQFHVPLERGGESARFPTYLRGVLGILPETLRNRLVQNAEDHRRGVADESLFFYAGLLALKPRSEIGLRTMIADYFGVPVRIDQFVGAWYKLRPDTQCLLGNDAPSDRLGVGSVIGDEIWDQQSRAQICLGPLTRQRYKEFLPGGNAHVALQALLRFMFGPEIGFDVRLILKRDEVPTSELDNTELQLGWLTWIKSTPTFDRNPQDTVIVLN
jgi:type VI secretion system protein ImpH